jgi:hypothetical protein
LQVNHGPPFLAGDLIKIMGWMQSDGQFDLLGQFHKLLAPVSWCPAEPWRWWRN